MKISIRTITATLAMTLAMNGYACADNAKDGFLPENNLKIPVGMKSEKGGLTEEQFNAVMDKVEALYAPIVASAGGKLQIVRNWTDGTVNAYASRSGNQWVVQMFGGLARHETITEDGMALVVCHEIGHHLGGAPKKGGGGGGWWTGGAASWASNEGQADTFATLKCLRKVFLNDNNEAIVRAMEIPAALSSACAQAFKSKIDKNICVRGGMSGMSVAKLFQALSNSATPDFTTPDTHVVARMDDNHPATQCRLDTYFAGALCGVDDNTPLSDTDAKVGACHPDNGDTVGNRPLCWFKP